MFVFKRLRNTVITSRASETRCIKSCMACMRGYTPFNKLAHVLCYMVLITWPSARKCGHCRYVGDQDTSTTKYSSKSRIFFEPNIADVCGRDRECEGLCACVCVCLRAALVSHSAVRERAAAIIGTSEEDSSSTW